MGRSRGKGDCAVKGGEVVYTDDGKLRHISGPSWCGRDYAHTYLTHITEGEDPHAFSRRMATCNKCSQAIGKVRLAQIADRVEIETLEMPKTSWGNTYRAFYGVKIDGERVGYILMNNGWGNPWELHEFSQFEEGRVGGCVSSTPSYYSKVPANADCQPVHSRSKEMLASLALKLRDKGHLLTQAELKVQQEERRIQKEKDDAERAANKIKWEAEHAAQKERAAERKQLALDGIKDVLERDDLTNLQRAGLLAAMDIIEGKSA